MEPVRGIRSEIDKARQKARERLARAGCRDEQRMLAALRYREHLGLMPPDPPAARGKPVGERDGERHGKDVAACEARGKAFSDRPARRFAQERSAAPRPVPGRKSDRKDGRGGKEG